jgi:hypothetical protein
VLRPRRCKKEAIACGRVNVQQALFLTTVLAVTLVMARPTGTPLADFVHARRVHCAAR